ncbi:hypothetical protein ACFYT3_01190 [Nocardia amikacinitolerans]
MTGEASARDRMRGTVTRIVEDTVMAQSEVPAITAARSSPLLSWE